MNNLIIDTAGERIFLKIISNDKEYNIKHDNCRENFDELVKLVFNFLSEKNIDLSTIDNIFVNQGPGKFSGIRASLATAKALSFSNKIDLYGFNSEQIFNKNYEKIIDLFDKGLLIKNLIKPNYLS